MFNPKIVPVESVPGITVPDKPTESELADFVLANISEIITAGKEWYQYENGLWQPVKRDLLKPLVHELLPPHLVTSRRVEAILEHIGGKKQIAEERLHGCYRIDDDGTILLNAGNGIVAVAQQTAEAALHAHSRDHFFTSQIPAQYQPDASTAIFIRTLQQVMPDPADQELFHLFSGYVLLPDCRYEVALCLYGPGGTGKSTLGDAIAHALGSNNIKQLGLADLCDPKGFHLPELRHAMLNLTTELDTLAVEDSSRFKIIVSGEPIQTRAIYGAPFTMRTTAKLLALSNVLPIFKHGSDAELRRLRLISCHHVPRHKDVALREKLKAERDGIFAWMVAGLQALLRRGEIPAGGEAAHAVRQRFAISNDPIGAFVAEDCQLDPESKVEKQRLTEAFSDFAERNGLNLGPHHTSWFYKRLMERYHTLLQVQLRVAGERVRYVTGLRLKPRPPED